MEREKLISGLDDPKREVQEGSKADHSSNSTGKGI